MYENYVMRVFCTFFLGGGGNLFKIKIQRNLVQESIVPAIVTLDNTSS